jgi:hypothetical protein
MVREYDESAPGHQDIEGGVDCFGERTQLVVHSDSQRLEDQRRRMVAAPAADPGVFDYAQQVAHGAEGRMAPGFVDGVSQTVRSGKFAVLTQPTLDLGRAGGRQQVGGGFRKSLVHAHIERRPVRRFLGETKAPFWGIELSGGDAEIEQHRIDSRPPSPLEHAPEVTKRRVFEADPVADRSEPRSCGRERLLVHVESEQNTGRADQSENRLGVTTTAHCPIHHAVSRSEGETVEALAE